ncbi:hypothetical protein FXO37_18963 [Capsicum annuum]|nr:hypothetical protein FXO37_18963 [Capsicum annuum]
MADPHALEPSPVPPMPPDPPDPTETITEEPPKDSFKSILLNKENRLNNQYLNFNNGKSPLISHELEDTISLSEQDKERIYDPWKFSVIVMMFKKKLAHNYLKIQLTELWKPSEPLTLIDLGNDFYIAKFNNPDHTYSIWPKISGAK